MAEITAPPLQIGRLLTALGTITSDTKVVESTVTWNAAVTFTAWKLNVTDTSSNAASLLADLQVGGVTKWKVDKTGAVTQAQGHTITAGGLTVSEGTAAVRALTATSASVTGASAGATVSTFTSNDVATNTPLAVFQRTGGAVAANLLYNATGLIEFGTTTNHPLVIKTNGTAAITISNAQVPTFAAGAVFAGPLSGATTLATALGSAWDFGAAAVVSPTSPNRTLRVKIGGIDYYIAAKLTND